MGRAAWKLLSQEAIHAWLNAPGAGDFHYGRKNIENLGQLRVLFPKEFEENRLWAYVDLPAVLENFRDRIIGHFDDKITVAKSLATIFGGESAE